jgi:hypothetical protein
MRRLKRLLSPGVLLGLLALFVATTGVATALPGHNTVRSDDIVNGQVKSVDVKDGSLTAKDVHKGTFQRAARGHLLTVYENDSTGYTSATQGTGMGASYTWSGALFDTPAMSGSSIGTSYGTCTDVTSAGDTGVCTMTIKLARGQITVTGVLFPNASPSCSECSGPVAVVGGTGDYEGAGGVMNASCDFTAPPFQCTYGYRFSTP